FAPAPPAALRHRDHAEALPRGGGPQPPPPPPVAAGGPRRRHTGGGRLDVPPPAHLVLRLLRRANSPRHTGGATSRAQHSTYDLHAPASPRPQRQHHRYFPNSYGQR